MTDTTIKVKGRKRAILAIFLSLIAIASSGYLYYYGLKVHTHTVYQLQSLNNVLTSNNIALQQKLTSMSEETDALNNKVSTLGNDRFGANNYQLNTLISLANQSLAAYHDVNAAIKLLTYAQNIVSGNNNAIYTGLKVAITMDLDKLKQLPVLDRVIIATRLNNIIANTDHLELIVNNVPVIKATLTNSSYSSWEQFLLNIKTKLLGLVQVSNANENDTLNLLPQNAAIIHQNIKLDILNARMALLQNDEVNWQYSLNAARQSMMAYFINSKNMQNIIEEINQLQLLDISYSEVSLEHTLTALNKLNNLSNGF